MKKNNINGMIISIIFLLSHLHTTYIDFHSQYNYKYNKMDSAKIYNRKLLDTGDNVKRSGSKEFQRSKVICDL